MYVFTLGYFAEKFENNFCIIMILKWNSVSALPEAPRPSKIWKQDGQEKKLMTQSLRHTEDIKLVSILRVQNARFGNLQRVDFGKLCSKPHPISRAGEFSPHLHFREKSLVCNPWVLEGCLSDYCLKIYRKTDGADRQFWWCPGSGHHNPCPQNVRAKKAWVL